MSMTAFEKAILYRLKEMTGKKRMVEKDLLEWSTRALTAGTGEVAIYISDLNVWACIPADKKGKLP